jgi:hypothetical protein
MLYTFDLDTNKLHKEQLHPKKWSSPNTTGSSGQASPGWLTREDREKASEMTQRTSGTTRATAGKHSTKVIETGYLKKFRREMLGKRVTFWADDYLEKNFPKTVDEDHETLVTIMGKTEDIEYLHDIYADVDLSTLGIRYSEDITKSKWSGTVEEVSVTANGGLRIHIMPGCKPMAQSLQLRDLKNWKESLRKMRLDDLVTMREEKKHGNDLTTWQKSQLNLEITFRESIQGLEQAVKVAKERGNGAILKQELKGDVLVYLDDDGNIYYETPVVVH